MKHIFIFCLMVWVTLGICNCKNDLSPSHITQTETKKEPTQKPEKPEVFIPEVVPQEPEGSEGETSQGGGQIIPPEIVPPQEGELEKTEPEEIEPEETKPEEDETQEIETPKTEPQETAILQINELRTMYSLLSNNAEYIEFKVMTAGTLDGISLYITYAEHDTFIYNFPAVDVTQNDYITLHLRKMQIACVDELGENLSLSGGNEACPTARDLWVAGNDKWLLNTDIVYLQDAKGGIMDAIIMSEKSGSTWDNDHAYFADITENLFNCGMWKSANGQKPTPLDAVNTQAIKTNIYKSVSRYEGRENTHSAKDWFISNVLTPGLPNK